MVKFNTLQGIDTHVVYNSSTVLLTQREHLADEALSIGADYTLWLDSDMVFPQTTAVRLMAHKKDVVVCNYVKRQPPFKGVAYPKIGDWENPLSIATAQDLVPVEGVGMGCFMHKTEILKDMKKPYFEFGWTPKSNDWLGEDMMFCQKIARTNRQIFVDTQLSLEMRHLGTWAFGPTILGLEQVK